MQNDHTSLRVGLVHNRGIITSAYLALRVNEGIDPEFGYQVLNVWDLIKAIYGYGSGLRQNLDFRHFKRMLLPVPPHNEQASIVRYLSRFYKSVDRALRLKRKLIALLNEQKQAIIHRVVTRGLDINASMKPSGIPWLGSIPKHWQIMPMGSVLVDRNEKNDPIKTDNILSLSLHDGVLPYKDKKRPGGNKAKSDLTAYKIAHPGDIVVNSMNVVVGSVGLSQYFGAVSPVYYMLRPRHKSDNVEYFNAIFQDPAFQKSLFGLGSGIMVIQSKSSGKLNTIRMRIPMSKLRRVSIPYPPQEEQTAIVNKISVETACVDRSLAQSEKEVELLREYRTSMIADVVTGKLDVREVAKNLPEELIEPNIIESETDIEEIKMEPVVTEVNDADE